MQFTDPTSLRGSKLIDSTGDKIGTIDDIYLDTQTGQPGWALVHTGLFGTKRTFVPLEQADQAGDDVRVPYEKALVKDAPGIDPDGALSHQEEQTLYQHYGLEYGTDGRYDAHASHGDVDDTVGHDTSGPTTDRAMTRSEEELAVGKRQVETGTARLRKYVVTEDVQQTVPVAREEVRVEREPITEGNVDRALDGPAISEEEHEVVLHAEEPVVEKRVVPKERVRLEKDTEVQDHTVNEELRKEEIAFDGDTEVKDRDRF